MKTFTEFVGESVIDRLEKFAGQKMKPGRNTIKGYPVDLTDDPDTGFIEAEAVDTKTRNDLAKELTAAGFKVKKDGRLGLSIH